MMLWTGRPSVTAPSIFWTWAPGRWGDCDVYEYDYAGPGTAQHPSYDVQGIVIGDLTVTRERYEFTIKKVDSTNPNLTLPGARFLVQNANGSFEQEVVTGSDGTVTLTNWRPRPTL